MRDDNQLHVAHPRHLTTYTTSLYGEDSTTICYCRPGSRLPPQCEEPVPSGQPCTGKLQPSQPQRPTFQRIDQAESPGTSKLNTSGHRKLHVRRLKTTPPKGRPQPHTSLPPPTPSPMYYPSPRRFPWKCISTMVRFNKACPGCHFNNTDGFPRLKFHQ